MNNVVLMKLKKNEEKLHILLLRPHVLTCPVSRWWWFMHHYLRSMGGIHIMSKLRTYHQEMMYVVIQVYIDML